MIKSFLVGHSLPLVNDGHGDVVKTGKLCKKSLFRGTWKVRLFTLQRGVLTFEDPLGHDKKTSISISKCTLSRKDDPREPYTFEIQWPGLNKSALVLKGASEDDVEDWLRCLRRAARGGSRDDSSSPVIVDASVMPVPIEVVSIEVVVPVSPSVDLLEDDRASTVLTRSDFVKLQSALLASDAPSPLAASAPDTKVVSKEESESMALSKIELAQTQIDLMKMSALEQSMVEPIAEPINGSIDEPPLPPLSESQKDDLHKLEEIAAQVSAEIRVPLPLPTMTKLEWLRRAKRELVSEADPRLQYDVDYNRPLGKGGFGDVYWAQHKTRGDAVAVKQMQINKKNRMEYLLIETDLHARASEHTNVVKFVDAFLLREEKQFWVVMEYIDGATLHEVKRLSTFGEVHACWVSRNVLDALAYIHHTNRIHRDIKSANVLLTTKGHVKLTDFGLAAQLTTENVNRKTMLGTVDYMAPEILRGAGGYGTKVDVWAMGMLMHEMLAGHTPFALYTDPQQVLAKLQREGVPPIKLRNKKKRLSVNATRFVDDCLTINPAQRPDSATLLEHVWFETCPPDARIMELLMIQYADVTRAAKGSEREKSGCIIA